MAKPYLCPIPWVSLSLGAKDVPRLCCHQLGPSEVSGNYLKLDHGKIARKLMAEGEIPKECRHCFDLEIAGCRSPREDYLERFPFTIESTPVVRYLDLTVDNDCNLECIMCSPLYSRKLFSFYEKTLNVVPEKTWTTSLTSEQLEKIIPDLEQVTLTGGEPFLSKKSLSIIQQIASSDRANEIILRVFTNLSHLPLEILKDLDRFKKLELILSIDSVGENYEFIRFPANWANLLQNIEKLKSHKFRELDLHQHTVLTATNWTKIGETINFFAASFPQSYNIIPIFVEIDAPGILHPRVLPEGKWEEGKASILDALKLLRPKNSSQEEQIANFIRLIDKMEMINHQDKFVEYQIFLQKVKTHRRERSPHGA